MSPASMRLAASGDGGHDGNGITILHGRGFFLQVANVLVIQVDVHEGAQLAILGVEMAPQLRMLGDQTGEGIADRAGLNPTAACFPAYCRKGVGM